MGGPDLQIREGPGHSDPEIGKGGGGRGGLKKTFFGSSGLCHCLGGNYYIF